MILFDQIIFGPVHSRRLGLSLGVNLLPVDAKICSFNCIYCECGFNTTMREWPMPTRGQVRECLERKLKQMNDEGKLPDVITFAGNGEPTLHPDFEEIIDDTIELRNRFCPASKVSVLTNSTRIHKPGVFRALQKVENPILKFDSAFDGTLRILDRPAGKLFSVAWLVEQMKRFDGDFIVQTMFLRGEYKGEKFDNTTGEEVEAWLKVLKEVKPRRVMIYSLDREAPVKSLEKITLPELNAIAGRARAAGFDVSVAG
ncbi:MAG: radical SAM protein [Prevotellaceae bacterium]|jgi:wyosine [tRNA(Phe)-imidazoG37] synthetase (radical SAM superfamily)|nr:radical SAM protein [Prevotellaceae bacterium]